MSNYQHEPKRPYAYFTPGELVFMIDHLDPDPGSAQDLLKEAVGRAGANPGDATLPAISYALRDGAPLRIVRFDQPNAPMPLRRDAEYFSIIVVDVLEVYQPEDVSIERTDRIRNFYAQSIQQFGQDIDALNTLIGTIGNGTTGSITLRAVSPNWITIAYPQDGGGGSPAAYPIDAGEQPTGAGDFVLNQAILQALAQGPATRSTEVIILDTAVSGGRLDAALAAYGPNNRLVRALLSPDPATNRRTFSVEYGIPAEYIAQQGGQNKIVLPRLKNEINVEWHDYDMTSHGIFIAGIVKTIAPDATIRIIQVMNDYGIGSLESFAGGIQRALNTASADGVVINCSFGIAKPYPGHQTLDLTAWGIFDPSQQPDTINEWTSMINNESSSDWSERMSRLALIAATLCAYASERSWITAAAGNNNQRADEAELMKHALQRSWPHEPAVFRDVIGVGALDETGNPTIYTHTSDIRDTDGFVTFGGTAEPPSDPNDTGMKRALADEGILGVYVTNIPEVPRPDPRPPLEAGTATTQGWAWWAGTSFSTAIISAILARFAAIDTPLSGALSVLKGARHVKDVGEVVDVTQP